jgi:hypothetical protein
MLHEHGTTLISGTSSTPKPLLKNVRQILDTAQTLQKPAEEGLRDADSASRLIEGCRVQPRLVDSAPKIVLHAFDPDEDVVHVPFVSRPWPAATHAVSKLIASFLHWRRTAS